MKQSLLVAACLALGTSFASAAITPAQIPAEPTSLAVMDPRAIYASPFWTAVDRSLTPAQKGMIVRNGFTDGTISQMTVCQTAAGSGCFLETAQDADTLINKTWDLKAAGEVVPCTILGYKAYRCDFSKAVRTVSSAKVAQGQGEMAFVVISPRLLLVLVPEVAKGAKPDFEKLAALFLAPKTPKLAPTSKLAKFLTLPAGLWVYGAFIGLDKELKSAAGNDPQAAALSGFTGVKSLAVRLGPDRTPAAATLSLRASCADEQSAAGVVGLATMMKGMLAMGGAGAGNASMPPELVSFINGIVITQDGRRINASTEVSAAVVKALVEASARAAAAPKHAAPAVSSSAPADADL